MTSGTHAHRRASSTHPARSSAEGSHPRVDRVLVVGLILIAAATGFRVWTAAQTWFYVDDFPLIATASRDGLDLNNLVQPYIGHLMPAGRLAGWLTAVNGHYDYPVAIAELAAMFALSGLGVLRLLRTLFGPRPAVLLLLTCYLLSPWLISPTVWWAAGINHLPALIATAWTLDAVVRYLREHHRGHLIASVLWMLAGLTFAELTLLAYIPVTLIALGYFARGSVGRRMLLLWRDHRPIVATHLALAAVYLAIYLASTWDSSAERPSAPWRDYLVNLLGTVVPTGFIGGPGQWHQRWAAQFEANPPGWLPLLGLAALAGTFALAAITRERSLRAWLIPATQLAASVVLMSQTRAVFGGDFILDLRFTTPLALGFPLALGLAFLPVLGALECAEPRQAHWLIDRRAPAIIATGAFVAVAVWSATTFPLLHVPADISAKRYFETFDASLAEHDEPVQLVTGVVPDYVFGGIEALYPTMLTMYGDRLAFPDVVQDDFYVLDDEGHLVHPELEVAQQEVPTAGSTECPGYLVGADGLSIPLRGPVLGYGWRLRIAYTASVDTPATISTGGRTTDTTLLAGDHELELSGTAPEVYDTVELTGLDPRANACVTAIEIGMTPTGDGS